MADIVEASILKAVRDRGAGRTICPSEVARVLQPGDWRPLMPAIREKAQRLQAEGKLQVTQKSVPVDPLTARGPIRLGLP